MENPATIADVEARYRPLTATEQASVSVLLDDALALLLARRPSLEDDLTAKRVSTANAIRVLAGMVIRVLRNPDGYATVTTGPFSVTRDGASASGLLTVTTEELAVLTPARSRVRSVRLVAVGSETEE